MTHSRPIQVLIADDHAVVRAGLRALLSRHRDVSLVGEASTSHELLREATRLMPDVAVVDLRMPGGDVFEAIRRVRAMCPRTKVVVFTAYDDAGDAAQAVRAGAHGYVLKLAPGRDVVHAIRRVHAGGRYMDDSMAAHMKEALQESSSEEPLAEIPPLSEREARVLDLLARGYTGPQIAIAMGVRVGTVESYRHRIRKKLGLKSRSEIMEFARTAHPRTRERRG